MCTLTVRRGAQGFQVTMNRDESLERGIEHAPFRWNENIYAPQDSLSNGTWIGMNPVKNLWACILNGYEEDDHVIDNPKSRGSVIPSYLETGIIKKSYDGCRAFRLLYGDDKLIFEIYWDGQSIHKPQSEWQKNWILLTSSSWQQEAVKKHRHDAFQKWLSAPQYLKDTHIPTFHVDQDEKNIEKSVLMNRSLLKRATTSITCIDIKNETMRMDYYAAPATNQSKFSPLSISDITAPHSQTLCA